MCRKQYLIMTDLDGTLVDTVEANYYSYRDALKYYGFELTKNFYYDFCFGKSYKVFLPLIVGDSYVLQKKVHDKKVEIYAGYYSYTRLNDGLVKLLRIASDRAHILLTTTATRESAISLLIYHNIAGLFDEIIAQEDVKYVKPSPECFVKAMKRWGVSEENCLIFEDSDIGLKAAQNAKITAINIDMNNKKNQINI